MSETAILKILFPPSGAIPAGRIEAVQPIRAHIAALLALAQGKPMPAPSSQKRVSRPDESEAATCRIVELWETPRSDGYRRTWAEVSAELGMGLSPNAVRHRYENYKAKLQADAVKGEAYAALSGEAIQEGIYKTPQEVIEKIEHVAAPPALQEAMPAQIEQATIRNSRIVQENAEVPRSGPKIPHDQDDLIFEMRESGKTYLAIVEALEEKGISCNIGDVAPRYQSIARKKAREVQNKAPSHQEITGPSLSEIDACILGMAERNALPSEMATVINRRFHENLTTGEIAARIRKLQQQKARK